MYPHERSLVEQWKDRSFALVGVNSDRQLARARRAVAENELNWRSFQNRPEGAPNSISDAWNVHVWPTIFILDQEMKVHYRGTNGQRATEVARELLDQFDGGK